MQRICRVRNCPGPSNWELWRIPAARNLTIGQQEPPNCRGNKYAFTPKGGMKTWTGKTKFPKWLSEDKKNDPMGHFNFSSSEDLEIRVEGFWNIYHFSSSFNWAVCVKPPISSHQVSAQSIAESRWLGTTPLSVSDKPKKTERPCCILTYLLYSTMGKGKSSSKVPWKKGDMLVPRRLIGNPLSHPIWDYQYLKFEGTAHLVAELLQYCMTRHL